MHKRAYAQIHWKKILGDKLNYQCQFQIYEALRRKCLEDSIQALPKHFVGIFWASVLAKSA